MKRIDLPSDAAVREFIEVRSIPEPTTGCWIWMSTVNAAGYAVARINQRNVRAHRASFAAFHGPIPPGMLVQHSCDTRCCVSPSHLSAGTNATNSLDMAKKGRAVRKLSPEDVRRIRARVSGGETQASVAEAFDVTDSTIGSIVLRKKWRHVA